MLYSLYTVLSSITLEVTVIKLQKSLLHFFKGKWNSYTQHCMYEYLQSTSSFHP